MQLQLFYALAAQTLIPIVLMNVPGAFLYVLQFLNVNLGRFSDILSITISLYPAVDLLPTIFIVKSYREALFRYIREGTMIMLCRKRSGRSYKMSITKVHSHSMNHYISTSR
ncbi:unnamed protein product [Caenorhabditis sp. 36 PRJEB53466]|nr:unnamed protein product [Caenorhabditis sp. 36 PRJEB53466]